MSLSDRERVEGVPCDVESAVAVPVPKASASERVRGVPCYVESAVAVEAETLASHREIHDRSTQAGHRSRLAGERTPPEQALSKRATGTPNTLARPSIVDGTTRRFSTGRSKTVP